MSRLICLRSHENDLRTKGAAACGVSDFTRQAVAACPPMVVRGFE